MAVEIALDMAPRFRLMNELGVGESLRLVEAYAAKHDGFQVPRCLREQAATGRAWEIPTVFREDRDGVAVITIRRPKVLNAMNQEAFRQLARHFEDIANDDSVAGAVITGFGVKAFVSGADVHFLAKIETPEQGEATSAESNRCVAAIENCGKPVVCAFNGFAFGGGNEIAMACNARIARRGLKLLAGQPEPNLGIIPGAGATQRLPRWIGVEAAAELLRTGKPISAKRGLELGLIQKEVEGDVVAEAIRMVKQDKLPSIERGPIPVPASLPAVELGHLSTAVDAVIQRAILEGCAKPLADGLAFEAKMFGEVCKTKDMRIGVDNFIANGPGSKAPFVNA
jgi:enoyl-CoA hydratase/carnithine racemase